MYFYHGTNKENADSIMKSGFNKTTYFTPFLDSALLYGGEYVFAIWKDGIKMPEECWQFMSKEKISPDEIISLVHYDATMIFSKENPYLMEGKCEKCHGAGEIFPSEEERHSRAWLPKTHQIHLKSLRHSKLCDRCHGTGKKEKNNACCNVKNMEL